MNKEKSRKETNSLDDAQFAGSSSGTNGKTQQQQQQQKKQKNAQSNDTESVR